MRWVGHVMHMGKRRSIYRVLLIEQAQDRGRWQALVNMVMNLWVP